MAKKCCNDANHAVNIKNLLEYSPSYAEKTVSNEFFFLDTSRNAEKREFEVSGTNQLAKRRAAYNREIKIHVYGIRQTANVS